MSNSFKRRLRLARQLSPADWLVLAEAWWALWGASLASSRMKIETLAAPPASLPDESPLRPEKIVLAQRTGRLLGLAARGHFLPMTCLVRALALYRLLERRGIPSRLRIGAARAGGGMRAHAWVEVEGRAVGESAGATERFAVFESAA
ncbi:MAG: lasso peptide biosynthesis B2 protein [Chloroflexota bacterium]